MKGWASQSNGWKAVESRLQAAEDSIGDTLLSFDGDPTELSATQEIAYNLMKEARHLLKLAHDALRMDIESATLDLISKETPTPKEK